jgi:hypothetical protein
MAVLHPIYTLVASAIYIPVEGEAIFEQRIIPTTDFLARIQTTRQWRNLPYKDFKQCEADFQLR